MARTAAALHRRSISRMPCRVQQRPESRRRRNRPIAATSRRRRRRRRRHSSQRDSRAAPLNTAQQAAICRNYSKPQCTAITANRNAPQLQQAAMRCNYSKLQCTAIVASRNALQSQQAAAIEEMARSVEPGTSCRNCGFVIAAMRRNCGKCRARARARKRASKHGVIVIRARPARSSDAQQPATSRNRRSPIAAYYYQWAISRNKAH